MNSVQHQENQHTKISREFFTNNELCRTQVLKSNSIYNRIRKDKYLPINLAKEIKDLNNIS